MLYLFHCYKIIIRVPKPSAEDYERYLQEIVKNIACSMQARIKIGVVDVDVQEPPAQPSRWLAVEIGLRLHLDFFRIGSLGGDLTVSIVRSHTRGSYSLSLLYNTACVSLFIRHGRYVVRSFVRGRLATSSLPSQSLVLKQSSLPCLRAGRRRRPSPPVFSSTDEVLLPSCGETQPAALYHLH